MQGEYNYTLLKDLLGEGIFAVDGDKWLQQRKISSHEFSTKALKDFSSAVFRNNAAKLADIVSNAATSNKTIDIPVSPHNSTFASDLTHTILQYNSTFASDLTHTILQYN